MEISEYIKQLREEKKLSINQLALYTNVSSAHISRIENGKRKPSPEILKKLSLRLDTDYEELLRVSGYLEEYSNGHTNPFNDNDIPRKHMNRIREWRTLKNVSREELANRFNILTSTLDNWEENSSQPDQPTLIALSEYFGIGINEIINFSESELSISSKKIPPLQEYLVEHAGLDDKSANEAKLFIEWLKIRDMQSKNIEIADELSVKD